MSLGSLLMTQTAFDVLWETLIGQLVIIYEEGLTLSLIRIIIISFEKQTLVGQKVVAEIIGLWLKHQSWGRGGELTFWCQTSLLSSWLLAKMCWWLCTCTRRHDKLQSRGQYYNCCKHHCHPILRLGQWSAADDCTLADTSCSREGQLTVFLGLTLFLRWKPSVTILLSSSSSLLSRLSTYCWADTLASWWLAAA